MLRFSVVGIRHGKREGKILLAFEIGSCFEQSAQGMKKFFKGTRSFSMILKANRDEPMIIYSVITVYPRRNNRKCCWWGGGEEINRG